MKSLRIYPTSINARHIDEAARALRDGQLIIYPTDTLYAIGCNALNNSAIERLCSFKGINPQKQTLSIVCADISQASRYALIDNKAFRILRAALPGPFTFILPASPSLPKVFKGRKTVGIRIPDNPIPTAIAEALDGPILSSSLLVDDQPLFSPDGIALEFENSPVDILIDGGEGDTIPSTVIDLTDSSNPEIVRQGKGSTDNFLSL